MAHDTNRIFVGATGVEVPDINAVTGTVGNDIGEVIEDGVSRGLINKWPKFKPVRSNLLKILTLADMQDVYFGLDVPIYGSGHITVISDFLDAFATSYAYLPPRGANRTPKEWYRHRDFEGYDKRAVSFASASGSHFPTRYMYGTTGAGGVDFDLALNSGTGLYDGISVSEWKLGGSEGTAFSSLYFGLLFVHGTDAPKIITASSVISSNGLNIHIGETGGQGLDGLNTSYTYTVYPILCSAAHTSMGSISNTDQLVAIPISPFSFQQVPASSQLVLTISNASASLDFRRVMTIQGELSFLTTAGISGITINCTFFRASYEGDTSGSEISVIGTTSFSGVTPSNPGMLDVYTQRLTNPPEYLRIHAVAPNESVQADFYILVTEETL